MTLTLDQVRQTRFHLTRRNGYDPVDVDNFVDKVEATLSHLGEENDALREQVEALKSSTPEPIFAPSDNSEVDSLRGELQSLKDQLSTVQTQFEESHAEVLRLRESLQSREDELAVAQGALDDAHGSADGHSSEAQALREQLDAAHAEIERLKAVETTAIAAPIAAPRGNVENIVVNSGPEASAAVAKLLSMATDQAERLVADAKVEANRIVADAQTTAAQTVDEANRKAHEQLTDAKTRADRVESEARVNAEKLGKDAQSNADAVNTDAARRRQEVFAVLENERAEFSDKIAKLKTFESDFRANLTNHLQNHIDSLASGVLEPEDKPSLLSDTGSATPRLDALINRQ